MAKDAVYWSDSKAGYDPGQRQSLEVKFVKRVVHKVTLSVSFSAHSLGQDSYTSNQRWNHAYIYVYRVKENGKRGDLLHTHDWKYQIHGYGGSSSHNKEFTFGGVKNGEKKFIICYENKRVGTNNPWYGPKSTGVVDKVQLNEILNVPDNSKIDVIYYGGGLNPDNKDRMTDFPKDEKIYRGKDYTVSKKVPKHIWYDFKGGYDTSDSWKTKSDGTKREVNTTNPSIKSGKVIKSPTEDIKLWACWTPKTYTYRYYPTEDDANTRTNEYKDLVQTRVFKKPGIPVPDLNKIDKYKRTGYNFIGWKHYLIGEKPPGNIAFHKIEVKDPTAEHQCNCIRNDDTHCWPVWEPIEGKVTFDYGYYIDINGESVKYTYTLEKYLYDSTYNLLNRCVNKDGISKKQTLARPGYKLVGWSATKPERVYNFRETEGQKGFYDFAYDYNGNITPSNITTEEFVEKGITLYAVWEYFSFMFVYTEGRWRLVAPYVYALTPSVFTLSDKFNYKTGQHYYDLKEGSLGWKQVVPTVFSKDEWRWPGRENEVPEPDTPVPEPEDREEYAVYDSATNILTFFLDEKEKYEEGQEEGTKIYHTGISDTRLRIPWEDHKADIVKIEVADEIYPFTTNQWFKGCDKLETIENLSNIKFLITYDVSEMFMDCSAIESIDLKQTNFVMAQKFGSMFEGCARLNTLDMTGCITSKAVDMKSMFSGCKSLETLTIPFDTTYVTDMSGMFNNCSLLKTLDLSTFDTSKVTNMSEMFNGCSNLSNISNNKKVNYDYAFLTNFVTTSVTDMRAMFKDCTSLRFLDLTSFDTRAVQYMTSMFENCSSLSNIYSKRTSKSKSAEYAGQFKKDALVDSTDMFTGCTKLSATSAIVKKKTLKINTKKADKSNEIVTTDYNFIYKFTEDMTDATLANCAWVAEKTVKTKQLDKAGKVIKKAMKDAKGNVIKKKKLDEKGKVVKDNKGNPVMVTVYEYKYLVSNILTNMPGYFTEITTS